MSLSIHSLLVHCFSFSTIISYLFSFQALEAEIQAHEPLIASVMSKGRQMIRIGHFAASNVEAKLNQLQSSLQQLKDLSSIRRLRLLDAVESQTVSITYLISSKHYVLFTL